MPLSFPLAADARAALDAELGARTIAEARELACEPVTLVSDWLRPEAAERDALQGKAEAGVSRGFVQLYEDARGQPVIAVTYWKPQSAGTKTAATASVRPTPDTTLAAGRPPAPVEDTTDDLYFAKPSSRTRSRRRADDPNQLDLFTPPNPHGAITPAPGSPGAGRGGPEGDGAAFGRAAEQPPEDPGRAG